MKHEYKTWVEVDKKALLNNAKIIRGLLKPGVKLMAVVKSNAYGHGLLETAKIFTNPQLSSSTTKYLVAELLSGTPGADWLGVDNIDEAILLRRNGIKTPILVMGYTPAEWIIKSKIHDLRYTIYDSSILKEISKNWKLSRFRFAKSRILDSSYESGEIGNWKFHLKVDTGMSRQGVTMTDLPKFLKELPKNTEFEGVFTHLANTDNLRDRQYPNLQLANFKKAIKMMEKVCIYPKIKHASATTGLLTMPEAHYDMVRVGVALYGLWPSVGFAQKFSHLGLRPVLSWKTKIVQTKNIKKGTPVGYGITERVKTHAKIAILPVGYFDGYFRALSSVGEVLIGGERCKILGRISMNLMVVDISKLSGAKVGDEVFLIGGQNKELITAEELAEKAGTISYEIVSRINPLLPRIYL